LDEKNVKMFSLIHSSIYKKDMEKHVAKKCPTLKQLKLHEKLPYFKLNVNLSEHIEENSGKISEAYKTRMEEILNSEEVVTDNNSPLQTLSKAKIPTKISKISGRCCQ